MALARPSVTLPSAIHSFSQWSAQLRALRVNVQLPTGNCHRALSQHRIFLCGQLLVRPISEMAYGKRRWRGRRRAPVRGRRFKRTFRRRGYRRRSYRRSGARSARKLAMGMKKVYQATATVSLDWEGKDGVSPAGQNVMTLNNPPFGDDRDETFQTAYFSGCKLRYVLQAPRNPGATQAVPLSTTVDPFGTQSPVYFVRVMVVHDTRVRVDPTEAPPNISEILDVSGDEYDPMMAVPVYNEQLILNRYRILYFKLHKLTRNVWAQMPNGAATTSTDGITNTTGNQVIYKKVWIKLPRRRVMPAVSNGNNAGKGMVYLYAFSSQDPAYTTAQKPVFTVSARSYFRDGTGLP